MPHFNSQELLQQVEDDVIQLLQVVNRDLAKLSANQLVQPPAPGRWSVAQCPEHLNSYGRYYLPLLADTIQRGNEQNSSVPLYFRSSWLGTYFANAMRPKADGRITLKMKAFKAHRPAVDLDAQAVLAEFWQQQQQLIQLSREARRVAIGELTIPISIARWIRLSVGDTFRFLIAHQQRHVLQAQRAAQIVREPKTAMS